MKKSASAVQVRSLKNRGACASACGTFFEVRTCVRLTGEYIATQSLFTYGFMCFLMY